MRRIAPWGLAALAVCFLAGSAICAAGLPGRTAADRAVYQKLESAVVSFTFSEQPLEEAFDFLQTLAQVNIVLDKRAVEAGKTVTLKLNNVELVTAIKLVCEQVGLKWTVRDGVVFVSNEEGVKSEPLTIVYDVADLLTVPPNFEGPTFELQNISGNRGGAGGGGGSGQSIFTDTTDKAATDVTKTREELLTELVDLIKQVIEPGTWEEGS